MQTLHGCKYFIILDQLSLKNLRITLKSVSYVVVRILGL